MMCLVVNLLFNPLKCSGIGWLLTLEIVQCHPGLTYILNFCHSGTLALRAERQSARMSEIKTGGLDQYGKV